MLNQQTASLHFAVRPRVIGKYTGQLLLVFAALNLPPLLFALVVGEFAYAWLYFPTIAGSGATGYLLQRLTAPADIQGNEALVISALIFCLIPLLVSISFYRMGIPPSDALFEAVSGITTTGLSTLPSVADLSRTFLFTRAWLQWTGGLGIVVLSVAIVLPHTKAAMRLFQDNWQRNLITSTRSFARVILRIYLLITFFGLAAVLLAGVPWQDSIVHVLAAVSTGGFSSHDQSLAGLPGWNSRVVVILISFLGAVSFGFYYQTVLKGWHGLFRQPELLALILFSLIAAFITTIFLVVVDGFPPWDAIRHGPLLAVSAQTTTGFSTLRIEGLSASTKFLLIPMMLVGGSIGSTAGGIKIFRLLVLFHLLKLLVIRSGLARSAVIRPRYMGKALGQDERERCLLLIILFLLIIALSWMVFILFGYPPLDSLFEVVSATCTVGLSTGITAPDLPALLKGLLCLNMLMGRLEIIAFLVLFYPPTWAGKKRGV